MSGENSGNVKPEGVTRRKFISAVGATATAAVFLQNFSRADDGTVLYQDSFGNIVPAAPDAIAAGVYPPPIDPPNQPSTPDSAGRGSIHGRPMDAREREGRMRPMDSDPPPTTPYNILMIMVDQLRAPRWLPPGGVDEILPSIASIRNCSFIFSNFFVAATACTPSRATILTGLYTQQTCMFVTQNADAANTGLQVPSLLAGGTPATRFDTFAHALTSVGYNVYWIGKWHLSDPAPSETGVQGKNGPTDYGFTKTPNPIQPTLTINLPPDSSIASPNGFGNLGTEGINPSGFRPTPAIPPGTYLVPSSYPLYNDAAICDWFIGTWMPNVPAGPWCTTVSFVNPHDITSFPYVYGLPVSGSTSFGLPSPAPTLSTPAPGYPSPPVTGSNAPSGSPLAEQNDEFLPPLSAVYSGIPTGWNYADDPTYQPYMAGAGKPTLQAFFQQYINATYGSVQPGPGGTHDPTNWIKFLNYYFWMQQCVDFHIGRVMTALQNTANGLNPQNTIVIFTSDHGEYAGSHWMKAKGGALYDESINVPLYVSYPALRANYPNPPANPPASRPYVCSTVDIFPFLYTIARGSSSWRTNSSDPYYYLANRENILDGVFAVNAPQHRLSGIANAVPSQSGSSSQPYVLHTTDEVLSSSSGSNPAHNTFPTHAVAFRTVDVTVSPQGGGKLGMYNYWPLTDPVTAVPPITGDTSPETQPGISAGSYTPQYEFYNYTTGNAAETGNSYTTDPAVSAFSTAFGNIVNNELYTLFPTAGAPNGLLYAQYNLALNAFSTYLSNTASAGFSFPMTED